MKELSLLYKYWCFIKINSLLRKRYNLISSDFITVNRDGIFVSLKKGVTSTLVYKTKKQKKLSRSAIIPLNPVKLVTQILEMKVAKPSHKSLITY